MADLVVVIGVLGFGAISVAFIWACDRIIGPDDDSAIVVATPAEAGAVAEGAR